MLIHLSPLSKLKQTKSDLRTRSIRAGTRPRALTLPLEAPQRIGLRRVKQQTFGQEQCPLFYLPYEIRELIWRAVVGGHCIAQDHNGTRIGDETDPWPPWETPGAYRRGLRAWGWEPKVGRNYIGLLLSCRRMFVSPLSFREVYTLTKCSRYSETIDLLYEANLFYFRNPFTNWSFGTWKVLSKRLQHVRVLVLDETIGDPAILKANPRNWKQTCTLLSSMPRLKILYFNVDTLYPKAWTAELENRLFAALKELDVKDLNIVLRWSASNGSPPHFLQVRNQSVPVIRIDDFGMDYDSVSRLYRQHPVADMRTWIIRQLKALSLSTA
jgi:hypothetical protein